MPTLLSFEISEFSLFITTQMHQPLCPPAFASRTNSEELSLSLCLGWYSAGSWEPVKQDICDMSGAFEWGACWLGIIPPPEYQSAKQNLSKETGKWSIHTSTHDPFEFCACIIRTTDYVLVHAHDLYVWLKILLLHFGVQARPINFPVFKNLLNLIYGYPTYSLKTTRI